MHPNMARSYGVKEGDYVTLGTKNGEIKIKIALENRIHPKVVAIPIGWSEANANLLTDWDEQDSLSGFPNLKAIPCYIRAQ